MRSLTKIYIHCSYSKWATFDAIDSWHKDAHFGAVYSDILKRDIFFGYHYLILNQFTDSKSVSDRYFRSYTDGKVIPGRYVSQAGCHVKGDNTNSIGICYAGVTPTPMQIESMLRLCASLCREHSIPVKNVFGHYEVYLRKGEKPLKTCPNFYMPVFRAELERRVAA